MRLPLYFGSTREELEAGHQAWLGSPQWLSDVLVPEEIESTIRPLAARLPPLIKRMAKK